MLNLIYLMRLIIDNKPKLEVFVAIFQLLKNWCSHISIIFEPNMLNIQLIDKSKVCFTNIKIMKQWFAEYDCLNSNKISFDAIQFSVLINYALKHNKLELLFNNNEEPDKVFINFLNETKDNDKNTSFDHFFELNLIDIDEDSLGIPKVDYDIEFTIETKKFVELLTELNTFGPDLNIKCNEELVELNSNSETTKLKVNIPVEHLDEFSISEGEILDISFSLNHLCKMCTSVKLSSQINVGLSKEYPMLLSYNLGDNSNISFYIAPKIKD
jgi:proliferating cell nuclear antigen PCNA